MQVQEFPKMLYKGEANTIVQDEAQDARARADGWHDFGAKPDPDPAQGAEGDAPKTEVKPRGKKPADPAQGAEG